MTARDLTDQDLIAEVVSRCQLGAQFRGELDEALAHPEVGMASMKCPDCGDWLHCFHCDEPED